MSKPCFSDYRCSAGCSDITWLAAVLLMLIVFTLAAVFVPIDAFARML